MGENLNKIISGYSAINRIINKLKTKRILSDVPIKLNKFEKYLKKYFKAFPSELESFTKLNYHYLDEGIPLLEASMSHKKAYAMEEEMAKKEIISYPVIYLSGENISEHFYGTTKVNFDKLFSKDRKNKTAKIYNDPFGKAVGISYRDKRDKLRYLELRIAR